MSVKCPLLIFCHIVALLWSPFLHKMRTLRRDHMMISRDPTLFSPGCVSGPSLSLFGFHRGSRIGFILGFPFVFFFRYFLLEERFPVILHLVVTLLLRRTTPIILFLNLPFLVSFPFPAPSTLLEKFCTIHKGNGMGFLLSIFTFVFFFCSFPPVWNLSRDPSHNKPRMNPRRSPFFSFLFGLFFCGWNFEFSCGSRLFPPPGFLL